MSTKVLAFTSVVLAAGLVSGIAYRGSGRSCWGLDYTADGLSAEFRSDPEGVKSRLSGKTVTVSGRVTGSLASQFTFNRKLAVVLLAAPVDSVHGDGKVFAKFSATSEMPFSSEFLDFLRSLSDGDRVTVSGRFSVSRDGKSIDLDDCQLVSWH